MQTTDEFKTILALTGDKRLPHLEAEIFVNETLIALYLHNLCKGHRWYRPDRYNTELAYYYIIDVIKGRWLVAESMIITNPQWAYLYAVYVIEDRWPEAEAAIKTDWYNWQEYLRKFGITDE